MREICCVVADAAPEFGIGVLITELLSAEASSWDALMIGLRALLCVLLAVPARKAGRPFVTEVQHSSLERPVLKGRRRRGAPMCYGLLKH